MNKSFDMCDNDTLKWEDEGVMYCLHVQHDDSPENPRYESYNLSTMACFCHDYDLGDLVSDSDAKEFWLDMVYSHVQNSEVYEAAINGKFKYIRVKNTGDTFSIYEDQNALEADDPIHEEIDKSDFKYWIIDDLTISDYMILMEPYAEWLPLWLYDHSGISISCGERTYPYDDVWDSSCIGWIVMLKKDMKDLPGVNENNWKRIADKIMKGEVLVYDKYLTGDVYGYKLLSKEDETSEWEEISSCWGFYGSNIWSNGIVESVGNGIENALDSGKYDVGTAELHTVSYYTY